ncbi:MAG: enoyl-CoA hydratase/isomerase family protein [Clostridia bacterium]|nr:enoyl-CoA hydratase/isomerase family protein [Clostridia bacterium]
MTLNRPDALNALDEDMRRSLAERVAEVRDDPSVRAVVLTGAGRAFCAGGDVKTMGKADVIRGRERLKRTHRGTLDLFYLEKPVVVAVNGYAVGVGFNVALAGDIILASEEARFSQIFAQVGLIPDGGGLWLLSRIVGLLQAKELVMTAEMIDARRAKELGIVREVYPPDRLLPAAMELAEKLAAGPTHAFGLGKALLHRACGIDFESFLEMEAIAQAYMMQTADHKEGVQAFLEKRKPNFRGA